MDVTLAFVHPRWGCIGVGSGESGKDGKAGKGRTHTSGRQASESGTERHVVYDGDDSR